MAQLRRQYQQFIAREAEIIVIGPEERDSFLYHWRRRELPFVGLPDPDHMVADLYEQKVSVRRLGRLPTLVVVDKQGQIRYQHYGKSMRDIPSTTELLQLLDRLNDGTNETQPPAGAV